MLNPTAPPVAVIVNDDPLQLHLAATILGRDGFDVIACAGAEKALEELAKRPAVDVIITDLYMPGIDGWRLCRLLRSAAYPSFNHVPIIVLSATFSGAEAAEITAQLGADAFLPAPYEPRVLRQAARDVLGNHKPVSSTHVLIVEPNRFEAELLSDAFRANGYAVVQAPSGRSALEKLREHRPQVVVLEADLPDMSGDRLLDQIKEPGRSTVAIVVTADASAARALELIRKGADNYLPKPFAPAYLLHLCETAARQRALTRVEELLELRTAKLRASERRYRSLFENAGLAIAVSALDGTVLNVNRAFERLTGRSRDDLAGKSVAAFLSREEQARAARQQEQARAGKSLSWNYESAILRADGGAVAVEAQCHFLGAEEDQPGTIIAMYRDLSAERLVQRQRAEFSAMLAHDIRNPVGLILGCAALLLDESAEPDADLTRSLHRRILDHGRVLQSLVNNYLDVSTIEAGQLALHKAPVDLPALLAQLAHRYEFEARQRSIELALDCRDCPGLAGDALAIERIVGNLLQNAFKFTPDGGRIALGCAPCAGDAVVRVADSGPGIDLKEIPCLFKKFKRVAIVERQEGLGLGLYIVKELAEAHGGRVEVESAPGAGSSFSVFLPLGDGRADQGD